MSTTMASAPSRPRATTRPQQHSHSQPRSQMSSEKGDAAYINVSETERWVSLLGGGVLAAFGLSRGTLLGYGLAALGASLVHRGATGHCHGYSLLGVNTDEKHSEQASIAAGHGVHFEEAITINASPEELFRFWRNFENLPRFMHYLQSVKTTGPKTSTWSARGPLGVPVSWDAEIITEKQNEMIGWRSLDGSVVDTAGSIHFTPAPGVNRGTEVKVVMKYNPPMGKAGSAFAWMFGRSAKQEVRQDLRRFKQFMETGVIPTTEGQSQGTCPGAMAERAATGLGLFSLGLGLAEIVMPDALARMIGVRENQPLMAILGVREIVSGLGILASTNSAPWVWSRVAGDLMDLGLLGGARPDNDSDRAKTNLAIAAVMGVTVVDMLSAAKLSQNHDNQQ